MISNCEMWNGAHSSTYQHEIEEWVEKHNELDLDVVEGGDIPINDWEQLDNMSMMQDGGGMFGAKTVLIRHADKLQNPSAKKHKWANLLWLLEYFQGMTGDVNLALVFQNGSPVDDKAVMEYADEFHDRAVPFEPDEMSRWMVQYLRDNKVLLDGKEALKVAWHVGEDRDKLVEGLSGIITGYQGQRATSEDVIKVMGQLGESSDKDLTRAIFQGDQAAALEHLYRVFHFGEFYLMWKLTQSIRAHSVLAYNSDADLNPFGVYGGSRYWTVKEAKLTQDTSLRALDLLDQTDLFLKGGSSVDAQTRMTILVQQLCELYSTPQSSRTRPRRHR